MGHREARRGHSPDTGAVKLMLPLLEGQLDQSTRRMYDALCQNFSAIGILNVKKGGDGHGGDT